MSGRIPSSEGPRPSPNLTPTPRAAPPPPTVARVEALLREGNVAEAVRIGYLGAEEDVRRAFGLSLPRQWTHREFLREHLRTDLGYVAVLLPQLHAVFEPVRYGQGANPEGGPFLELLRALYQEPAVLRLFPAPSTTFGILPNAERTPTSSAARPGPPPNRR